MGKQRGFCIRFGRSPKQTMIHCQLNPSKSGGEVLSIAFMPWGMSKPYRGWSAAGSPEVCLSPNLPQSRMRDPSNLINLSHLDSQEARQL